VATIQSILGVSLLGLWDAEDASTFTLSGSAVSAWRDKVAAYSAAQAVSGAKPVYGATSFNGRPGVTFDGADDELTYAGVGAFPTGADASELWALADQTALVADTTQRTVLAYGGVGATGQRRLQRVVNTGVNRGGALVGTGGGSSTAENASVDLSGRHVLRASVSATATGVDVDGTAGTPGAIVPGSGTTRTRIGANGNTTVTGFWSGVVSTVIITSALSAAQAAVLTAHLKARGGIA